MAENRQQQAQPKPEAETVTISADLLRKLEARLDHLERAEFARQELTRSPVKLLDQAYETWKADVSRSPQERSQEIADKLYGTKGPRFRIKLEGVPQADTGKTPDVSEHPELVISGHSDLEAKARYEKLCGINSIRNEYARIVVEAIAA